MPGVKCECRRLLEAALAGSVDDAVALLREHYQHAAKIILDDPRLFAADGVG